MVKGIIFDMDGVLVDTEAFYRQRREEFLRRMDFTVQETEDFTGSNEQAIWEALVPADKEFRSQMLMGYRAYRRLHPAPYRKLMNPQVPELFAQLKDKGLKTGIASSSDREAVVRMTEAAGVTRLVDYIISGQDCTAHKPSPEIYLRALEALGLTSDTAVAVEDSAAGIAAAKGAGLRVYALRPRHGEAIDQSAADAVLDSLADVWKFL